MASKPISPDFPFESKFIEVHGSNMHYIDEGSGDPILFLHGNPTSSYLWRNVVPYLIPHGRCIAPDLIGMGKSDSPALDYRFVDHSRYLEALIDKLKLSNVTLVLHDWGSALGFHYAMRFVSNIKGIAFMESMVKPITWDGMPLALRIGFTLFRAPVIGWILIRVMNVFIKQTLPRHIVRDLSLKEQHHYGSPYRSISSRKPLHRWPREIPIEGRPADMHQLVSSYSQKLQVSKMPKLLLHADPGVIFGAKDLEWCKQNLKNLDVVEIGQGLHYVQEDNPHAIGEELSKWYQKIQASAAQEDCKVPSLGVHS